MFTLLNRAVFEMIRLASLVRPFESNHLGDSGMKLHYAMKRKVEM